MADRRPKRDFRGKEENSEFDQKLIDIARVTRVMAGGKRMRFRACVVIGDHKGKIGYGLGKGADVSLAITKAVNRAKKDMIDIPLRNGSLPHEINMKYKAARLLLKPAPSGTGVVAGGAIRAALELSGIDNIVAKMYGSKNKINNIRALFHALERLKQTAMKKNVFLKKEKAS
ncbi:30S ribosomal protein S5 [Candidatus Uhrbacteria bacterium]|nr:30S ribosomal protein S5 [Candidatus Uhrbacteria bacterium]